MTIIPLSEYQSIARKAKVNPYDLDGFSSAILLGKTEDPNEALREAGVRLSSQTTYRHHRALGVILVKKELISPRRDKREGPRSQFNLRLRDDLRDALQIRAKISARTESAELHAILEKELAKELESIRGD